MTVFNTAYDTTAGKGFTTVKVISAIKESIIKDYIHQMNTGINTGVDSDCHAILIANHYPSQAVIPYFTHPILVELGTLKTHFKTRLLCTDVRPFASSSKESLTSEDSGFLVKNRMEFDLAKIRTILNFIWITERPMKLRDISFVPMAVYASWISENVSRRFALDPKDQYLLSILSAIFYQTLFSDEEVLKDEDTKTKVATSVMKATKASAKDVYNVLDQIEDLNNLKDFCTNVRKILDNPRLQDFNEGMVITLLGTSWFGTNAKEMLAVAIEHPPTWLAIVYSSFVERSFKNSAIAKISERYGLNKGQNDFTKALISLVSDYTGKD